MKVKQSPAINNIVYIKNIETNRITCVDMIAWAGINRFETKLGYIFDLYGEPSGSTANVFGDCIAYVCNEEEEKFYSRMYLKKLA